MLLLYLSKMACLACLACLKSQLSANDAAFDRLIVRHIAIIQGVTVSQYLEYETP